MADAYIGPRWIFPPGVSGRRAAATGTWLPPEGRSHGGAPPIFFLRHQKENAPRPVEKKKCSAGRSAQAQTSCRRRGKVGGPLRKSGTETRRPWGNLQPGAVRDTLSDSPRCRSRFFEEQPAAAKREAAQCVNHPVAGAPSATGRQLQTRRRPKRARRPGKIGAGTDTPTPVARGGPLHRSAPKRPFLLDRARPVFFSARRKRKWGVHPAGQAPCGNRYPRGRRSAALPFPADQLIQRQVVEVRQGDQCG